LSLSKNEIEQIERSSRQQQGDTWHKYRRGRITASNFKKACVTSIDDPAISTIKKICYPSQDVFGVRPLWENK